MAGYGAELKVDMKKVKELPTGSDPASVKRRRMMFRQADMSGNGIVSLAECDRLIVDVLRLEGMSQMKPVINRAFHAARDIVPPVGDFSPHYVDFYEFRFFLIYLQHYLDLFMLFVNIDQKSAGDGRYSDRRLSFKEFKAGVPKLIEWGVDPYTSRKLRKNPAAVWRDIDDNEGGLVLFDEFAHWALYHKLFHLDSEDAEEMAEALEVLKKQKPNLCGKDLKSIQAHKAKYRVDAPISGQGCLRGDAEMAGGRLKPGDGGKELAAGRDYPGSLKAWKASLARCDRAAEDIKAGPKLCKCGCKREAFGRYETCCTHCTGPDGPHARDCISKGYAQCENGCGHLQFGRFTTCCTHCTGANGPHARDCLEKMEKRKSVDGGDEARATPTFPPPARAGPALCKDSCGRQRFMSFERCKDCLGKLEKGEKMEAAAKVCAHRCGRLRFMHYKTCCNRCQGPDGPHAFTCEQNASR